MAKEEKKTNVYCIPENFIEGGRIFNGMFKLRNFVEAVIFGGTFGFIGYLIPVSSASTKITVVLTFALPVAVLSIIGINDEPLSTYVKSAIRWKKSRNVMYYDERLHARSESPLDTMMAVEPTKDIIISKFDDYNERKKQYNEERIKNTVFEFEEDTDLQFNSPLRNLLEKSKEKNKEKAQPEEKTEEVIEEIPEEELDIEEEPMDDELSIDDSDGIGFIDQSLY